jgi:predicted dienelactone hydrolase
MDRSRRVFVARSLAGAALLGLGLGPCARALRAQEPAYQVIDLDWTDAGRGRAVPVRLYLPQAAAPGRPVPLVVFSHGMGGSRYGYSYLGRHWAGQGLASLHLQHVGSDRSLWGGGSVWALVDRLQGAAQADEAVARVQDLRFALDRLLADELGQLLDAGRIVAAGHSYGANTALLAAGARVQREDLTASLQDERLRALILISAPPFYGEGRPQPILAPVRLPSLHITATEDVIRIPGYYSGADDRLAIWQAIGSTHKTLAVFTGGSHSMFTDRMGTGGAALNAQVKLATQGLTLAFMRKVFDGDDAELSAWPTRHADIVSRFERGAS